MDPNSRLLMMGSGGAAPEQGWDLSSAALAATPANFLPVADKETEPRGIFVSQDGTNLYISGNGAASVHQYELSSANDVGSASFIRSFSTFAYQAIPGAVVFKEDGTKMYVAGNSPAVVVEYTLTTAWDISTAVFVTSFSTSSEEAIPTGLAFKPDGTKMYVGGNQFDVVVEYTLSTPWSLGAVTYVQSLSVQAQDEIFNGLAFRGNGTKMYVAGDVYDAIYEYTLSTPWDISTAGLTASFNTSPAISPQEVTFSLDGTVMYIPCLITDHVYQYTLSTPWSVSSAAFQPPTTDYLKVVANETNLSDSFFKSDGTTLWILGSSSGVSEYSLSTPWQIETASFVQSFSVNAEEGLPRGLFFRPDGGRMYVIGNNNDRLSQYDLSIAWNISTASLVSQFNPTPQTANPYGVAFKGNGSKMWIISSSGFEGIFEYNLSTQWDVSSASYVATHIADGVGNTGLFFKPDGTKLYLTRNTAPSDSIYEYTVSTPWDLTTAVLSYIYYAPVPETVLSSLFFKLDDGKKMYAGGTTTEALWAFDL